ncbi:MAG TPA: hypothetical protein PLC00_01060 [Bacteroidales bacterium]|nr:hypothetical protein [Bacteroidales bacterium]
MNKNDFIYTVFMFFSLLKINSQTTKNVELCFYDQNREPINEVFLSIECNYCNNINEIYTDTCYCINYNFICDKIYMIIAYHEGMYSLKEYIENPCDLEKKEYYFEKMKQSSH